MKLQRKGQTIVEVSLSKAGVWITSLVALVALGSSLSAVVAWKLRADDSHVEVEEIRKMVVVLSDNEYLRKQKDDAERKAAVAAVEAQKALVKQFCIDGKLDKNSAECKAT